MKNGAIVCNSGHFDVEVDVKGLAKIASEVKKNVRNFVDEYIVGDRRIYLLAEGRLVNLAAAEGHPASVMDMSFSTQALACAWMATQQKPLSPTVYEVPSEIEEEVAIAKLSSMKIAIDTLTPEQKNYLGSWEVGT